MTAATNPLAPQPPLEPTWGEQRRRLAVYAEHARTLVADFFRQDRPADAWIAWMAYVQALQGSYENQEKDILDIIGAPAPQLLDEAIVNLTRFRVTYCDPPGKLSDAYHNPVAQVILDRMAETYPGVSLNPGC